MQECTRPEPFNSTPMGVNSLSLGGPRVRPMAVHRTRGEPNEIKKTHLQNNTAFPSRAGIAPVMLCCAVDLGNLGLVKNLVAAGMNITSKVGVNLAPLAQRRSSAWLGLPRSHGHEHHEQGGPSSPPEAAGEPSRNLVCRPFLCTTLIYMVRKGALPQMASISPYRQRFVGRRPLALYDLAPPCEKRVPSHGWLWCGLACDRTMSPCKDYDARTPLHIAAAKGDLDIIRFLLENGASVRARGCWGTGWSTLHDGPLGHELASLATRAAGARAFYLALQACCHEPLLCSHSAPRGALVCGTPRTVPATPIPMPTSTQLLCYCRAGIDAGA